MKTGITPFIENPEVIPIKGNIVKHERDDDFVDLVFGFKITRDKTPNCAADHAHNHHQCNNDKFWRSFQVDQWYKDNNLLAGATGQIYTPVANGNFHVVCDYYGCDLFSDTINLTEVGIEDLGQGPSISIQPNPSDGLFTIRANGLTNNDAELTVLDVLGAVVYGKTVITSGGSLRQQLDLGDLSTGQYFLRVNDGENTIGKKLLIEQ